MYRPPSKEFTLVEVPPMSFLMIDGHGDPNAVQEYQDAVEALYAVAYKVKSMNKRQGGVDYVVPPLEGLWWAANMDEFATGNKGAWYWTMMIMQPASITPDMVREAAEEVEKDRNLPALPKLRFETYHEGLSVQIMYVGPYEAEGPTIAGMHAFIGENGYEAAGKHHEIYLSDPRRTAPDKLKTVLRQPIRRVGGD